MANINNHLITFIKISVITTLLFGGLLAQSYATNLVTDSIINMNIEFAANNKEETNLQTASIAVKDKEVVNFSFGDFQVDIKSNFIDQENNQLENHKFLAEVKLKQLNETGDLGLISTPSMLILRNQWAEFELNGEQGQQSIKLKIQYDGG